MPFRVLRYMMNLWTAALDEAPNRPGLPLVVPLVIANVVGGWRGPRSLEALFEGSTALVEAARVVSPRLELVVDDLSTLDVHAILDRPGPPIAQLAWWLLSVSTDVSRVSAEVRHIRRVSEAVRDEAPNHHEQAMRYLQTLPMTTRQRSQARRVLEFFPLEQLAKEDALLFQDLMDFLWVTGGEARA